MCDAALPPSVGRGVGPGEVTGMLDVLPSRGSKCKGTPESWEASVCQCERPISYRPHSDREVLFRPDIFISPLTEPFLASLK